MSNPTIAEKILTWYDTHGRKNLPWKNPKTDYSIWLSEIMLQQTQVTTVMPYFQNFISQFPDVYSLANASLDQVMLQWAGLGYYARARNLHKSAQHICTHFQGRLPANLLELQNLPGIGRSTAAAILAQSYDQRAPILDGNVKRILARLYAIDAPTDLASTQKILWDLSEQITPNTRPCDFTQAIMDLGAGICKKKPLCQQCPIHTHCIAFNTNRVAAFPQPKKRTIKKIKQSQFIILFNHHNELLLKQHPAKGIWGRLWCLPEIEAIQSLKYNILSQKSIQRHSFTHFHLDYTTLIARTQTNILNENNPLDKAYKWFKLNEIINLGMPTPHQKLIKELE